MYRLITDIIQKEYNADVRTNQTFTQFFETNFINTFQVVSSEQLTDFNQHLLDTQLNYYRDFVSKVTTLSRDNPESTESKSEEGVSEHQLIHSYQRMIHLTNSSRHNYRIKHTLHQSKCVLEKVILPLEDTALFMNPLLIVVIGSTVLELHMRGTIQLRDRTYGIYTPFFESPLEITSDTTRIQFRNQIGGARKDCDVYPIIQSEGNTITLETQKDEFKVGDVIRLCNFKDISLKDNSVLQMQYTIQHLEKTTNTIITLAEPMEDVSGLYVMNMSLQNTLHFSKSELL